MDPGGLGEPPLGSAAAAADLLLPLRAPLAPRDAEPVFRLVVFLTSVAVPFFLDGRAPVGLDGWGGPSVWEMEGGSDERGSDLLRVEAAGVGTAAASRSGISSIFVSSSNPSLVSLLMGNS